MRMLTAINRIGYAAFYTDVGTHYLQLQYKWNENGFNSDLMNLDEFWQCSQCVQFAPRRGLTNCFIVKSLHIKVTCI